MLSEEDCAALPTAGSYERMPVEGFGEAVLRAAGWTPGDGVGREPKAVPVVQHAVRPPRLGFGATVAKGISKHHDKMAKRQAALLKPKPG